MKVGITGHQDVGNVSTIRWVEKEISKELDKLNPKLAFSSLAVGADQLFAALILSRNLPLVAVLPCKNYEKTFQADNLKAFHFLLNQASQMIQLDYVDPTEIAFYDAGKRIVEESDTLFAVWNNQPAKGLGGTADVVSYAKSLKKKVIHFNPVTQTIHYMYPD